MCKTTNTFVLNHFKILQLYLFKWNGRNISSFMCGLSSIRLLEQRQQPRGPQFRQRWGALDPCRITPEDPAGVQALYWDADHRPKLWMRSSNGLLWGGILNDFENGISLLKTLMFGGFNNIFVCREDCGPRVSVSTVVLLLSGWNSARWRNPDSPNKPQCAALKQILVYISMNRSCNNKANPNLMMCKRSAKAGCSKTNMRERKRKIQVHPSYVHFPFRGNYH